MCFSFFLLFATVLGQQPGKNVPEVHPPLPMTTCLANGTCYDEATTVVLDMNWRWLHNVGGYTNCYTGTSWNTQLCPDPVKCAANCALEGADYAKTYEITTEGKQLTLGYVAPGGNVGSRTYLLDPTPPPTKHNYTAYKGRNCYAGHGGQDIDQDGVSNLSVQQCTQRCDANSDCSCVTYQMSDGHCWLRGDCIPAQFQDDAAYSVYVKSDLESSAASSRYRMFKLKNREFSVDIDVSALSCGLNGALYFVEMDADGGMAKFPGNKAGAAYGTGYCDAQCPHDIKFIDGEANILNWSSTTASGLYGTCCTEMDIWEANAIANALTPHPCLVDGQTRCSGTTCGGAAGRYAGVCDQDGCDFNPWRVGNQTFFGPGAGFSIDSTKPFTVATSFLTSDGTDSGDLVEIQRHFVQDGRRVPFPAATLVDPSLNSISDDFCVKSKKVFQNTNDFAAKGGLKRMGEILDRGMVLVMSLWDDSAAHMLWLDSDFPTNLPTTQPGVSRGPCSTSSGVPADVRKEHPTATTKFSNIKLAPIAK